jgi:hypothetical protein
VWSWRPDAGAKFSRTQFAKVTETKEPGHRGSTKQLLKLSRGECRCEKRVPVVANPCAFCSTRGCDAHPVFPAPSYLRGTMLQQGSRRSCRGNADAHPLRCLTIKPHRRPGQASDSERRSKTHNHKCLPCAMPGPLSFLRQTPVVMGPGFRWGDVESVRPAEVLAKAASRVTMSEQVV